jgi:protein-S-isoprenylcysteine O-methyltransferase Ste14
MSFSLRTPIFAAAANLALISSPAVFLGNENTTVSFELLLALVMISVAVAFEFQLQKSRNLMETRSAHDGIGRGIFNDVFNFVQGAAILLTLQGSLVIVVVTGRSPTSAEILGGLLLMTIGLTLRVAAIRELGEAFSDRFTPTADKRIQSGPYRLLRHPAELGLLLFPLGFALLVGAVWMLAIAGPPLVALYAVRIALEELAMHGLPSDSTGKPESSLSQIRA